jgi:hypothetical protein
MLSSKLAVISDEYTTLGGSNLRNTLRIDYINTSNGSKNGSTIYTYIPQQNDADPRFLPNGVARKVAVDSSYNAYIPVTANRTTVAGRYRAGYIKVYPNNYREMENNFISRGNGLVNVSTLATALNSEGKLITLTSNKDQYSNYYNSSSKADTLITSIDPGTAYNETGLGTDPVFQLQLSDFSSSTANEAQHTTDSTKVLYTTSGLSQNAGLTVSTPAVSLATEAYVTNLDTF